ncbi:PaaI family thioesterase [Fulvivirga sedimenti]|uniref:PaaI family thioesterase n=1 Tax=Fulvivirga sedimenti TaxID=2879465 RepID=A0A9X1HKX1_9BACT|nr:PaaI family thioesterase [Fulvivirga sedimenti]MCA6073890.1 PaaI family thioesterase [Fulvivirga sedimenti]
MNDYKQRVKTFLERQYFMKHIGFDLNVIEEGRTEGVLEVEQIHHQQKGLVHGGVIATLADITAGFAAYTMVQPDHHVVTGEIKVSYLNPGVGKKLRSVGWVLKSGKKLQFCEAEVYDIRESGEVLIAKATTTMVVLSPGDLK